MNTKECGFTLYIANHTRWLFLSFLAAFIPLISFSTFIYNKINYITVKLILTRRCLVSLISVLKITTMVNTKIKVEEDMSIDDDDDEDDDDSDDDDDDKSAKNDKDDEDEGNSDKTMTKI